MNIRYIINEEKKTIVAIIEGESATMAKRFLKASKGAFRPEIYASLCVKDRYVGKAKCDPFDEFDIDLGKKLAARRASVAYESDCLKAINSVLTPIDDTVDKFIDHQIDMFNHEQLRLTEIESDAFFDPRRDC